MLGGIVSYYARWAFGRRHLLPCNVGCFGQRHLLPYNVGCFGRRHLLLCIVSAIGLCLAVLFVTVQYGLFSGGVIYCCAVRYV